MLKISLLTLAAGFVCLTLAIFVFQRRLLYLPKRFSLDYALPAAAENGFQPWRNARGEVIGWKLPSSGTALGAVLIAHGNAGSALNRSYLAQPIHQGAPLDVYVLEYPGYGARGGSPSEKSLLAAADEAFDLLPKTMPVYLVSESLGTGVVAHLAKEQGAAVAGMALFVPYGDLASVAQNHFPFLPAKYLLWDDYAPAAWLVHYRGPIQFIIAGADEVIATRLGLKLYEGYAGPKNLQLIPGARHNEVSEQSPGWWGEVFKFWQENPPAPRPK